MKTVGIIRKVDELGRVVLPIEMRRTLDIEERDPLEISLEGETIVLRKVQCVCVFCGDDQDLLEYTGKCICSNCRKDICSLDD